MSDQFKFEFFVPDGVSIEGALKRTTHLGVGAHQDDLEIMAIDGILKCFKAQDGFFAGVTVTDGRSSARAGLYAQLSDEEMKTVRYLEQQKAATIGNYSAQVMLGYTSSQIKDKRNQKLQNDLEKIIARTSPKIIYTHNLADKHPVHIAVAMSVINAIRNLDVNCLPERVYGCEVWRDLDWLSDEEKVIFDCSDHVNLQAALLGVFDSQINGAKRYDTAVIGRRLANATFYEPFETDQYTHLVYAMDLTPLIKDKKLEIAEFVCEKIMNFKKDVSEKIRAYD